MNAAASRIVARLTDWALSARGPVPSGAEGTWGVCRSRLERSVPGSASRPWSAALSSLELWIIAD